VRGRCPINRTRGSRNQRERERESEGEERAREREIASGRERGSVGARWHIHPHACVYGGQVTGSHLYPSHRSTNGQPASFIQLPRPVTLPPRTPPSPTLTPHSARRHALRDIHRLRTQGGAEKRRDMGGENIFALRMLACCCFCCCCCCCACPSRLHLQGVRGQGLSIEDLGRGVKGVGLRSRSALLASS